MRLKKVEGVGRKPCFCVSTNTGHYEMNGLKHHNSVAIQNVAISCVSHWDKISVLMIDPKLVEFSNYNGMRGITGVANSTLESVEVLRIARQVMYKRNDELKKLGLKNVGEYQPTEKSGKVFITGREINEEDIVKIRENGVEKEMTAAELVEYLRS